jgi:hypothetical protein
MSKFKGADTLVEPRWHLRHLEKEAQHVTDQLLGDRKQNRIFGSSPWEKVKQFPIYSSWQVLKRSNRRNTGVRKPFV